MTLQKSLENNGTTASPCGGELTTGDQRLSLAARLEEIGALYKTYLNMTARTQANEHGVWNQRVYTDMVRQLIEAWPAMATALSHAEAAISSAPPSVEGAKPYPIKVFARGYVDGPADYLMSDDSIETLTISEKNSRIREARSLSAAPVPPQKGDSMDNDPPLLGGLATGDQSAEIAVPRGKYMGERTGYRVCCHHISNPTNRITYPKVEPLMTWDAANEAAKAEEAKGYMVAWVIGRDGLMANKPTEAEHHIKCGDCGGDIDCRDLGSVFAHEGPLPHTEAAISAPGTPVVSNTHDEAAVVQESSPLDVRADMLAALEPLAKISLWRDMYPDAKSDVLTSSVFRGYIEVEDVRRARAAIAAAKAQP